MKLSADRVTAARMLMRVENGAFSTRLLSGDVAPAVRVRVLEVLRSLRALDVVLQRHCRRKLRKLDAEVRTALRIGLAETMRLDVPPALATDGAVHLVRSLGRSSASSMVNAVLRKATAGWQETLARTSTDVRLSHPTWIFLRWNDAFGEERTELAMASAQEPAVTWVWFLDDEARRELVQEGIELTAHPWCPDAWSAPWASHKLIERVGSGKAYAQDPSSQLVAHVARALVRAGGRIIDLCAAPGGKTALMLRLGEWDRVVAVDLRLQRAVMIGPLVQRVGHCPVVAADAAASPFADGGWDLVLLDAPCTGTGTFRRHPEIKWRLDEDSVTNLAGLQERLIGAGLKLVAPGGVLVYSTCSVEPEENEGILRDLPEGFELENLVESLPPGVPWIPTPAGGIRILPNPDGDGFTIHAVRRRS